jgi:hypothetical protein
MSRNTANEQLYSKPTEHRQVPTSVSMDGALFRSSVLGVSNPSPTAKRFVRAYRLVDAMVANAKILRLRYHADADAGGVAGAGGNNKSFSMDDLKQDPVYLKQCISLIEANTLTDQRVGIDGIVYYTFPLPSCWNAVTKLAPLLEGMDSKIQQLGSDLSAESFVILLATATVLAVTTSPHPCLRIIHELRIHAECHFTDRTWKKLEGMEVDSLVITQPTESSLRFALAVVGVKIARRLYRQRDDRQAFPNAKPLTSKVLLDSIETFARDQCKFRPLSGTGYRNLGWIAVQSVAKRGVHPLEGAAESLALMKQCVAVVDDGVEDDDFHKAGARIEAAMCMVYGAEGIVGYKVLGDKKGSVRRDMRSEKSRRAEEARGGVPVALFRVSGDTDEIINACIEYEKRRLKSGVPITTQEPGEHLIIARWEVLKLWNEAMSAYDSIQRWGHERFVYGEVGGWDVVVDFLQRTNHMKVGQYAPAPLVPGFPAVRDRGHDGESHSTCCLLCGKTDGTTMMKCSRCKTASYCSKDCQKGDWKKHKGVCKLLEKA